MLDLDRLAATEISRKPFAHVIVRNFVPPAALAAVARDLPDLARRGSFPIASLQMGPHASGFISAIEGPEFRRAIATKFSLDLDDAPTMVTLRGQSRERDGKIHCDSKAKRVTVLLYLNLPEAAWARQEGCLRLLRGPDDIEDYAVEVPPVDGTLLAFPNGPTTWHGHKEFIGRRTVVQLNYMTNDLAAQVELRRHRLSAFVKRLTLAA